MAWQEWQGSIRRCPTRQAGLDLAWSGDVRLGKTGMARLGEAWLGLDRLGRTGMDRRSTVRQEWRDRAGRGAAGKGGHRMR